MGCVEIQEQSCESERGTEHYAGRDVTTSRSPQPDHLNYAGRHDRGGDESCQSTHADEVGARTPGRADVANRFGRKGLTTYYCEDADQAGDDGNDTTDNERSLNDGIREEPGLDDGANK